MLFLKVAEIILDTEALAAGKASKTATGTPWQLEVKRDAEIHWSKGQQNVQLPK